ncbi:hypothetical protein HMPREF0645_0414 [Hallella bergensis DSM 17361]|uniref:Uncharacterized protein n=1 Tax=Hallella bergensis DSM 17361 TaxID=585502 RepID=D1PTX9_9BACT|nr:hypothetical protein HMPREF0645_0414 [Hallella bergensis DSM 17361]
MNLYGQILISNKANNQGQLVGSNKAPDNQEWVDRFFRLHPFFFLLPCVHTRLTATSSDKPKQT